MQERKEKQEDIAFPGALSSAESQVLWGPALERPCSQPGSGTGLQLLHASAQTFSTERWTVQTCFDSFDDFLISLKGKSKSQNRTSKNHHFPPGELSCGFQFNHPRKPGLTTALRIRIQKADLGLKQRTGRGGRAVHLWSILMQLGVMIPSQCEQCSSLRSHSAPPLGKGERDTDSFKSHRMTWINIPFLPSPNLLSALSEKSLLQV